MKRTAITCLVALGAMTILPGNASAADKPKVVVDDDRAQCADADYTSISEAVHEAPPGAVVQVCPGRYREWVVVDKPLTIRGQLDEVEAVDCFDPTPGQLDDLDATRWAIVEPPDSSWRSLFSLSADNVELAGFVLQGLDRPTPTLVDGYTMYIPAVAASSDYSGYQIHHNLVRKNTLGIELGSNGATQSRAHHNCLRENKYGLANQRQLLKSARVDHNQTFRSESLAYEIGWGYAGTERVTLDHNASRGDSYSYRVENTTATRIDQNTVEAGGRGIYVRGGNVGLELTTNVMTGGSLGEIFFDTPTLAVPEPTTAAVITGNTITGNRGVGIVIVAQAKVTGMEISGNVITDNGASGIVVLDGNNGNVIRANISDRNGLYGIRTGPNTTGNIIESNQMLGNGQLDAWEQSFTTVDGVIDLANDWTGNQCATDKPAGAICGAAS
ncbi:right-handed parallel beta-helix repeat-containing protein [Micromonospora sp. IBHARD004]|uniref:right-handed parallel beta-helix repeat-containing protein n=1 Tax=Micromonospora sp. IBHARD004 TaxID=3457764 RepID=UPI0040587E09